MRTNINYCLLLIVLVSVAAVESLAAPIIAPIGLNPGDSFRVVFVTTTKIDATSTDINVYNAHVNAAAGNNPDLAALGIDWRAIASAGSPLLGGVNARTNTSTDPSIETGVPIYLLNGTKFADNNADLWDGTVDIAPRVTELVTLMTTGVWTGTGINGFAASGGSYALGVGNIVTRGVSSQIGNDWIDAARLTNTNLQSLYAISGVITYVPEPGTALLLGLGLVGLATRRK